MTDRPVMFSAPGLKALLAGQKTQTRRLASSPLAKVQPGDRLWVREAFALAPDGSVVYRADAPGAGLRWKPWLHMPRWASRLTLTVVEVRFARLRDISEEDALAEGVEPPAIENYAVLWDHMHGDGSWERNPELVAVTFTVRTGNIDKEGKWGE